jgi:hypothetical protein
MTKTAIALIALIALSAAHAARAQSALPQWNFHALNLTPLTGSGTASNVGTASASAPSSSAHQASNTASTYSGNGPGRFDLVTVIAAPVPEPGSLALMLAGLGVVGFVARRRA